MRPSEAAGADFTAAVLLHHPLTIRRFTIFWDLDFAEFGGKMPIFAPQMFVCAYCTVCRPQLSNHAQRFAQFPVMGPEYAKTGEPSTGSPVFSVSMGQTTQASR